MKDRSEVSTVHIYVLWLCKFKEHIKGNSNALRKDAVNIYLHTQRELLTEKYFKILF